VFGWCRTYKGTYGFLNSEAIEGDIFVGASSNLHLPKEHALQPGDQVSFTLQAKGTKIEAIHVTIIESAGGAVVPPPGISNFGGHMPAQSMTRTPSGVAVVPPPGMSNFGAGMPASNASRPASGAAVVAPPGVSAFNGNGMYAPNMSRPKPAPGRDPAGMIGLSLSGWVKSFRGTWGFIKSDAFDGDLFVGASSNKHLEVELKQGDMVHFVIVMGNNGKVEAQNVQVST